VFRESLSPNDAVLDSLQWSYWFLAFHCDQTINSQKHLFRDRKPCGKKRKTILSRQCYRPAVYEFSVQTKPYKKKVVVYGCVSDGFERATSWEYALIGRRFIQYQLNNVLSFNCRVYVRRASLRVRDKVRATRALKKLDYAWSDCRGTGKHRKLSTEQIPISMEFRQRRLH